jgi:hypothetical protein
VRSLVARNNAISFSARPLISSSATSLSAVLRLQRSNCTCILALSPSMNERASARPPHGYGVMVIVVEGKYRLKSVEPPISELISI